MRAGAHCCEYSLVGLMPIAPKNKRIETAMMVGLVPIAGSAWCRSLLIVDFQLGCSILVFVAPLNYMRATCTKILMS
jgi:hypothetical protein